MSTSTDHVPRFLPIDVLPVCRSSLSTSPNHQNPTWLQQPLLSCSCSYSCLFIYLLDFTFCSRKVSSFDPHLLVGVIAQWTRLCIIKSNLALSLINFPLIINMLLLLNTVFPAPYTWAKSSILVILLPLPISSSTRACIWELLERKNYSFNFSRGISKTSNSLHTKLRLG